MSGVDSLDALRKRVRLRGSKVGAAKCVWADGFAMETIATHYQLLLLVVDERSTQKFTRISPQSLGENGKPNASGSSIENLSPTQPTVLLHSSQREHMNLILYDGRRMQQLGSLPPQLQRLWNLSVAPVGAPPRPNPLPTLPAPAPPAAGAAGANRSSGKRRVGETGGASAATNGNSHKPSTVAPAAAAAGGRG